MSYRWFGRTDSKWEVVPLRKVAKLGTGHTPSRDVPEYWVDCTIPWVTVEDIREHGEESLSPLMETKQLISELGLANSAAVLHPKGTVMLSRTASIGFTCVIGKAMATTQAFVTWTPDDKVLDAGFLHAALRAMDQQYTYLAYGTTHLTIYFPDVKTLRIPLPPISEQKRIFAFLDRETAKIDALIAEQEKLLTLLAEKRQATISHAVTKGLKPDAPMKDSGVEWLGEVPAHWELVGFTKYIRSIVDYRGKTPTKVDEGVFLVTAKNIRDGKIDYEASQEYVAVDEYEEVMRRGFPQIGDILFTTEAPLGQVAQVDRTDIALAQRVIKFQADEAFLDNGFIKYWVMGSHCQFNLELLATGSTALGIKGSKIGQIRLLFPPKEEQKEIVRFLDNEFDRLKELQLEATSAIDLLKERRTALISAAVTGKIDVRHLANQEAA